MINFIHFWNNKDSTPRFPENIESYQLLSAITGIELKDIGFGFLDFNKDDYSPWTIMNNYCIFPDVYDSCAIFTVNEDTNHHIHMCYSWSDIVCALKEYGPEDNLNIMDRLARSGYGLSGYQEILSKEHWSVHNSLTPMQIVYDINKIKMIEKLNFDRILRDDQYLIDKCHQYNLFYTTK